MRSRLKAVESYAWGTGESRIVLTREQYWPGCALVEIDGKRYIATAPDYQHWREPDTEVLACGHEQPVRVGRGRKYYNRRRRCDACAVKTMIARMRLDQIRRIEVLR